MSSSSAGLGFITNILCLVIIWSLLYYLASGLSSSSAFSFGFCFTIRSLPCHPRVLLYLFVLYRLVSALSYGFCFTILFLLYHLGVPLYYLISAQLLRTAPLFRLGVHGFASFTLLERYVMYRTVLYISANSLTVLSTLLSRSCVYIHINLIYNTQLR